MRRINPDNCLIHSEVFQKSIVDYNIMLKLIEDDKVIIMQSDDALLAIKSAKSPVWMWVWIDPDKLEKERHNLLNELIAFETESSIESIWGYEEIVKSLAEIVSLNKGAHYKLNSGMNAYYCPSVIIDTHKNTLVKANIELKDEISKLYLDSHEGVDTTKAEEVALELIQNGSVYLLKNEKEFVSMANVKHISMGYARINAVYTPIRLRCNGYATELMAQLSKQLLDDNLVPVLYTEVDNLASNKVYRKVGYLNTGKIVNASLIKE